VVRHVVAAIVAPVLRIVVIVGGAVARIVGAVVVGTPAGVVRTVVVGAMIVHRAVILRRAAVLHVLGTEALWTEVPHAAAEVAHAPEMATTETAAEVTSAETTTEVTAAAEAATRVCAGRKAKNAE
jgi:hypothetical protein